MPPRVAPVASCFKCVNAGRDENPGIEWPEIPAETPCLAPYRKYAVREGWMVGATEVPEISINNNLHEGEGDNGPLKRNGYFEDRPHLYRFARSRSERPPLGRRRLHFAHPAEQGSSHKLATKL